MAFERPRGPGGYFTATETRRLVKAIRDAEQGNRGEVRVHVEGRCRDEALERAKAVFGHLKMNETRDGTGVLLYVAVRDRKVAVFAGEGIVERGRHGFWDDVVNAVAEGYRCGDPVAGLESALDKVGALLREAAPGDDDAGDELPNAVTTA